MSNRTYTSETFKQSRCPLPSFVKFLHHLLNTGYHWKNIQLLGYGKEGYVFSTEDHIFKYIPNGVNLISRENLTFLEKTILKNECIQGIRPLSEIIEQKTDLIFVSPYIKYTPYLGGNPKATLTLLADAIHNGYTHTNFKPENIMYNADGRLQLIDIGRDLQPFNASQYQNMILRAYLTTYFTHHPDLKQLLSSFQTPPSSEHGTFLGYVSALENLITSQNT